MPMIIDLNGTWTMKRLGENESTQGTVPGSVYNDLLKAEKIEDPFYRDNKTADLQLSKYDYQSAGGTKVIEIKKSDLSKQVSIHELMN